MGSGFVKLPVGDGNGIGIAKAFVCLPIAVSPQCVLVCDTLGSNFVGFVKAPNDEPITVEGEQFTSPSS